MINFNVDCSPPHSHCLTWVMIGIIGCWTCLQSVWVMRSSEVCLRFGQRYTLSYWQWLVCSSSIWWDFLDNICLTRYKYTWLLASERSERDTYRGNTIENRGCLFIYLDICLDVCMSFCTLTLRIFVFAPRSTPSQTSLNRILRFSDHYPYHLRWILLRVQLKRKNLWELHFYSS